MSNVSLVSMYNSIQTALAGIGNSINTACEGAEEAIRWLTEETQEDKEAVEQLREQLRRDRQIGACSGDSISADRQSMRHSSAGISRNTEQLKITSVGLHMTDPESLTMTAEKMGYKVIRPSLAATGKPRILLQKASGERLAITANNRGKLSLHTTGDQENLQPLMRKHTLDRAVEHLSSKGMGIQTSQLPNGDVQILAREKLGKNNDGSAKVRSQIRNDGTLLIDVDEVKGSRCQEIVSELASAVGGQVSYTKKKSGYFQLPGEPARTKVKI